MVSLSGSDKVSSRLDKMEPALLPTPLVPTHGISIRTTTCQLHRRFARHLSSRPPSAAARCDGPGPEPGGARLNSRVLDARAHLSHAAARVLADLAVSGASPRSHARVHPPRAQRAARALLHARRPSWARSTRSHRDARDGARRVGGRRAGGERGRGARLWILYRLCRVGMYARLYMYV